jgi:DNA repair protein RAD5
VDEEDAAGFGDGGDGDATPGTEDLRELVAQFQSAGEAEGEGESGGYSRAMVDRLLTNAGGDAAAMESECAICFEDPQIAPCYLPRCMHSACKACLLGYLQQCIDRGEEPACPTCRTGPVAASDLIEAIRTRPPASPDDRGGMIYVRNNLLTSTKVSALISHLNQLRAEGSFKGVIFSQFTSFLDVIQPVLARYHFRFLRLDGTTPQKQREKLLVEFQSPAREGEVVLFLISLKAGGVGLNLTAATKIWLLDFWWNSSIEHQAIDRIHRLGQTKPVNVYRYLVKDSIENRILQIQKRKDSLIHHALNKDPKQTDTVGDLDILFAE